MSDTVDQGDKRTKPPARGILVAGAWARVFAACVDAFWSTALAYVLLFGLVSPRTIVPELSIWFGDPETLVRALHPALQCLGLGGLFLVVCEGAVLTSPGKLVFGRYRILHRSGQPCGRIRAVLRAAFKSLSVAILLVPQAWALVDSERRTLYDRFTGTVVGRMNQPSSKRA